MNCINCSNLKIMDKRCASELEPYYCIKYQTVLDFRYADEEFPEIEPCEECDEHPMQRQLNEAIINFDVIRKLLMHNAGILSDCGLMGNALWCLEKHGEYKEAIRCIEMGAKNDT